MRLRSHGPQQALTVHLIEAGGSGGVFQHVLELVNLLARHEISVVLHTAEDAEARPARGVEMCGCVHWRRGVKNNAVRRALIGAGYVVGTLPHLRRAIRPGDVAHIQGTFKPLLTMLTAMSLHGRRLVFSPHNTFSRSKRSLDMRAIRMTTSRALSTVVYASTDIDVVRDWGGTPTLSRLLQYAPSVDPKLTAEWRRLWGADPGVRVILFAGQIRPDKRLDLLVHAATAWPPTWVLAVVGEDKGHYDICHVIADDLGVSVRWSVRYVPLDEFIAAIAAADVVVCPYDRASQSGVLSLAQRLSTPTVASHRGGLADLATLTFDHQRPDDLNRALKRALDAPAELMPVGDDDALKVHLKTYGLSHP